MRQSRLVILIAVEMLANSANAADVAPQFDRDIVPLLKRHCVKCHGPTKQEAKLNLSISGGLVRGGRTGAVLVPHDLDASLLWKRVASDEMPPDAPLSSDEKSLLKQWIIAGTPGLSPNAASSDPGDHWAFHRLPNLTRRESRTRPDSTILPTETSKSPNTSDSPSSVQNTESSVLKTQYSPLDTFIAADLARDGLTISPEADRATQIRRVSFDLTGLPPTPEEIVEFLADARPDAYERMVDRFLASPHFGERLGKLWLDAAGYADSNGYFNADTDRPLAYRYRDYVIRSINADKPYDQFVKEQIAGDEIAAVTTVDGNRVRNGEAVAFPVTSPPSSEERIGVRGPNDDDAASDTTSSPSTSSRNSKPNDSQEPLTLTLSPQNRGEGTNDASTLDHQPSTIDLQPSTVIELIEATHYLRNGQDGTGESDGNPDEVRVDRYTVIETVMQNLSTGLLGLTIQCAKCHDHKFEPLTQRDYYSLQAVLIPAFPPSDWLKPNDRFVYASLPGEFEAWQEKGHQTDADIARLQTEIANWVATRRPRGKVLFADDFDSPSETLGNRWSNTAPGDDAPGGTAAVNVNSREAPGAIVVDGRLQLIEGGPDGDKWLSTKQTFDWTPDAVGAAIQVTFDLVDHHVGDSKPAGRIGYFIALHDFNDNSSTPGGNILIDGHPSASTAVHPDYPGTDSKHAGVIGTTGYQPGRNYGVRITNKGNGKFLMEQLVDWQAEEKTITFAESDLPPGGFGFEFCCGRSFVVDNVVVEAFGPTDGQNALAEFLKELEQKRQPLNDARKTKASLGTARPGRIAWTTDLLDQPPQTHVFLRGNYNTPGDPVEPRGFAMLSDPPVRSSASSGETIRVKGPSGEDALLNPNSLPSKSSTDSTPGNSGVPPHPNPLPPKSGGEGTSAISLRSTGRRLAFANWITQPDSPPSALLARVHVNRLWQHHFGTGIVATPDNFGLSGAPPSHPELLDGLAGEFVRSGWSSKRVARSIVNSAAYRQSSATDERRWQCDADARRLSRFPVRRLYAEAIRDSMLAASGDLDERLFGPYIPTSRTESGETVVSEDNPGSRRRSIYLQQKRTQVHSLLQVFDAPSIVFNSTRRATSTMPLQSLSLLNSDFSIARATSLASRLRRNEAGDSERLRHLFMLTTGREPSADELAAATRFLSLERTESATEPDAQSRAWVDLCQSLLIGNAALYIE
jgi:Protein of unknown function (DUF1553)/Protein of unknown function (DUF1549)/Planctomycete cytochrome C